MGRFSFGWTDDRGIARYSLAPAGARCRWTGIPGADATRLISANPPGFSPLLARFGKIGLRDACFEKMDAG